MDSLLQFIQSLGGDVTSLFGGSGGNPLMSIIQMLALAGDAYTQQQMANFANTFSSNQARAMGIGLDPAKLATQINQQMNYLTPTQQRAILGPAESAAASRGMATSPGQMQIIDEQAMAPYYLQERQLAQQAALQGLQLPFQARPVWPTAFAGNLPGIGSTSSNSGFGVDPFSSLLSLLGGGSFDPFGSSGSFDPLQSGILGLDPSIFSDLASSLGF